MLKGLRFTIRDGRLRFCGVSFGHGDSDPTLVERGERYMVTRTPGRSDWSALGESSYYPAEWELLEVEDDGDGYRVVRVVKTLTPGRKWRAAKAELLQLFAVYEADASLQRAAKPYGAK